jgi:hypothetical protein
MEPRVGQGVWNTGAARSDAARDEGATPSALIGKGRATYVMP